jgi:glutamyl-tRNA synthetase
LNPILDSISIPSQGRLAPSPTGAQHVGNARTFLVAWLIERSQSGRLLVRIEDLDTPRTKGWATQQAIEDLAWLGLDWDDVVSLQSTRAIRYQQVLTQLQSMELVYPCTCSRSEIEESASAPHESALDGIVYPGTCSHRSVADAVTLDARGERFAWRFRMPAGELNWIDLLHGPQTLDARRLLGDFVVARNYGPAAYQLAVTVDDHDQNIARVVRGDDLIYSTYRQLAIYRALEWSPPLWLHVPLVIGPDGKRLAKRHGDSRLSLLREQNVAPERLIGMLAKSLGLQRSDVPISAKELLGIVCDKPDWWRDIPPAPWVYDPDNRFHE